VRNAKLVVTVFDMIHEIYPSYFQDSADVTRKKRAAVRLADEVLCISRSTANDLVDKFGVPPEKIRVTYLGASSTFSEADIPAEMQSTISTRPYILYVGTRDGHKNFSRAITAYAQSARLLRDFDFVAFGGHALGVNDFELFRSLGIPSNRVRRQAGSDFELAKAYRQARALIYPSEYEGFGIPLLEAMCSDCPVVCSNASSIPEVVGEAGEYFDPLRVDGIQSALERVCYSESRRAELIVLGRRQQALFSWDKCVTETCKAYY
jgi:glycosyltransferase involved in cell wall biosynthesis